MHQSAWRPILINRGPILPSALRVSRFSQKASLSADKQDGSQKAASERKSPITPPPANPSYPAFSFRDLGANRTVKIIVIGCLAVVGTMESLFWAKVLWAKISPPQDEGGNKSEVD
jgi:hypothetical protein